MIENTKKVLHVICGVLLWRSITSSTKHEHWPHCDELQFGQLFLSVIICFGCCLELILLIRWNSELELLQCTNWASAAGKERLDIAWSHPSNLLLSCFDRLLSSCLLRTFQGIACTWNLVEHIHSDRRNSDQVA